MPSLTVVMGAGLIFPPKHLDLHPVVVEELLEALDRLAVGVDAGGDSDGLARWRRLTNI